MTETTFIPRWADDRQTRVRVSLGLGVLLAAFLAAASFAAFENVGFWVSWFFGTLIPVGLVAVLILLVVARRITIGPAASQKAVPLSPWLVGYVLGALPTLIAALCLLALAIISWVFGWEAQWTFGQALIVLLLCFFVVSVSVKILLNAQLLLVHWRER